MARINSIYARTTALMSSDQLLARLQKTQSELMRAQQQSSTGKAFTMPSEAPDKASAILFLNERVAAGTQYLRNLQNSLSMLNNVDSSLGEATDILLDAKNVAMSQIGVGSDATTRETESYVVDAQLQGLIELANRQVNQVSLFGGRGGAAAGGEVFQAFLGVVS